VHPDVAYYAVLAAKIVGLDIAGMDMILKDVSKPMQGQGAILKSTPAPAC
jgi:cyanophycin synthetase